MRSVQQDPTEPEDDSAEDNDFFVGSVHHTRTDKAEHDVWQQSINVEGQMIHFLLDTVSEVNILPTDLYDLLKLRDSTLQPTTTRLQGYFGGKVMPKGQKKFSCEVKNKTYSLIFKILDKG